MESSNFLTTLIFILLFYILLLVVLNRTILYKSFKTFALEDDEIKTKLPFLIAGNVSVFISLFILIKPFINFITYQINNEESMFFIFSVCSIVFIEERNWHSLDVIALYQRGTFTDHCLSDFQSRTALSLWTWYLINSNQKSRVLRCS